MSLPSGLSLRVEDSRIEASEPKAAPPRLRYNFGEI
jgi:hypothetical protein